MPGPGGDIGFASTRLRTSDCEPAVLSAGGWSDKSSGFTHDSIIAPLCSAAVAPRMIDSSRQPSGPPSIEALSRARREPDSRGTAAERAQAGPSRDGTPPHQVMDQSTTVMPFRADTFDASSQPRGVLGRMRRLTETNSTALAIPHAEEEIGEWHLIPCPTSAPFLNLDQDCISSWRRT